MALPKNKNKIIFIVGPTGVGKTEIAAEFARKINGEVISCDSMQIYKKMNIITQKPNLKLRNRVRHHLLGMIPPEREYSVSDYQEQALLKIKDIIKRKKLPVFAGGTGFYMNVLLDGVFEGYGENKKLRRKLYDYAEKYGRKKIHNKLKRIDPQAAAKIHPNDLKRVIRALEVYECAKVPISQLQKNRRGVLCDYAVKIFCLYRNKDKLYKRIDIRTEEMFNRGLVREVKELLGAQLSKTASQAIGIKEIEGYLKGEYGLEEARRLIKRNSRRYAKRQLSWFRRDKRINWILIKNNERKESVVKRIWKRLR